MIYLAVFLILHLSIGVCFAMAARAKGWIFVAVTLGWWYGWVVLATNGRRGRI